MGRIERNKAGIIPPELQHEVQCLYEFYGLVRKGRSVTIQETALDKVLDGNGKAYLVTAGILKPINDQKVFTITTTRGILDKLGNEIAALLWIEIANATRFSDEQTKLDWFFEVLFACEIWPGDFAGLLQDADKDAILDYTVMVLLTEPDLEDKGLEFKKTWLDQPGYDRTNLFAAIPPNEIKGGTPLEIISAVARYEQYFQLDFSFTGTRDFYRMLVVVILANDLDVGEAPYRYPNVRRLVSANKRPYIINQVINTAVHHYPGVLPYLLVDPVTAPLLFYGLQHLELSAVGFRPGDEMVKFQQMQDGLTIGWTECLNIFLSLLSRRELPDEQYSRALYGILKLQAKDVYKQRNNYYVNMTAHFEAVKKLDAAFQQLAELKQENLQTTSLKPRIFPRFITALNREFEKKAIAWDEPLTVPAAELALSVKMLRLCNTAFYSGEVREEQALEIAAVKKDLCSKVFIILKQFFFAEIFKIRNLHTGEVANLPVRRQSATFGFEHLDWAFIFIHLFDAGLLQKLEKEGRTSIVFDKAGELPEYLETNRQQSAKIFSFVKALALACIGIKEQSVYYGLMGLRANHAVDFLYGQLFYYSTRFSVNDISNDRVNIFKSEYLGKENNFYYKELGYLVFTAFASADELLQKRFTEQFFEGSIELELMLKAVNIFQEPAAVKTIHEKLGAISVDKFIASRFSITDLEAAMIEAINSDEHYHLAKPLLERIEQHLEKRPSLKNDGFLFQVKLLLLLKEKKWHEMVSLPLPLAPHRVQTDTLFLQGRRKYFEALYKLYNDRDFSEAILELEPLLSADKNNFEWQYRYFDARVKMSVADHNGQQALLALLDWDKAIAEISDDIKSVHSNLSSNISYSRALAYTLISDIPGLETTLQQLPQRLKYDEELISLVYNMYHATGQLEKAVAYARQAWTFLLKWEKPLPVGLQKLFSTLDHVEEVKTLKQAYNQILGLSPALLINTLPDRITSARQLDEFLLQEIIGAGKILMDKIRALDQITIENKYNDLLLAILRSRFPLFNLQIADQPRAGTSPRGKDGGEIDFMISRENENVGLIEALILTGRDAALVKEHIEKCNKYLTHGKLFYLVTYYKGANERFLHTWTSYQRDVKEMFYKPDFQLLGNSFSDLTAEYRSRNIYVGKTHHTDGVTLFHLFFNIG